MNAKRLGFIIIDRSKQEIQGYFNICRENKIDVQGQNLFPLELSDVHQ